MNMTCLTSQLCLLSLNRINDQLKLLVYNIAITQMYPKQQQGKITANLIKVKRTLTYKFDTDIGDDSRGEEVDAAYLAIRFIY